MANPSPQPTSPDIPVDVRDSAVHGRGAFARVAFQAGDPIARYEGRRYTAAQARRRKWNDGLTYLFDVSDGSLIDGSDGGNATRHINHSCEPNCVAYEIEDEDSGEHWIQIEALQDIAAGTELLLDYQLDTSGSAGVDYSCRCGAAQCRGTMVGVPSG